MFETPANCDTWVGYVWPGLESDPIQDLEVQVLIKKINEAGKSVVLYYPSGDKVYSLAEGVERNDMHMQLNEAVIGQLGNPA